MQISEFFRIFDLSHPHMEKVSYFVSCRDYNSAKKELLKYFIKRKQLKLSSAEEITSDDENFPLAYISRHSILSGPNEADRYLSSMFVAKTDEYTTLDILPFIKNELSFLIMSRQKENEAVRFYSPNSIFPPFVTLVKENGEELKIFPKKFAYISTKSPDISFTDDDVYEICEESSCVEEAYGSNTGRVYLSFDFSNIDLSLIFSARFSARITMPDTIETKELLFFNITDSSWDNSLTWNKVKGNVYSWESSPTGPEWISPENSDSEYLNVTCRFWFARPMAYQYLSDVERNSIYGEKLLFLMDAFSKKKEGGFNRVLETGERLSNFTCVLNALVDTPVMTPDYLVAILSIMYRDIKALIENPDLGWSNWAVVRTSGLSKAIDFLPELKNHTEWKNKTRDTMNALFDKMYSPDFSFREAGLAYSFWCLDLFATAFNSASMNNDPYSAFMRSRLEKAFDTTLDLLYPNLYDTNIGDSNYCDKRAYIKKVGTIFPTKKLASIINKNESPDFPLSVIYPYSNSVIMRNTLKGDSMYIALHSSPFDGHAHDDLSSLVMYAYGKPLITDSGRYGYSQSKISSYLKTAAAHNSIEIENMEYSRHSESEGKIIRFITNNAFDYAEITQKPYKEINATHLRRVLFVKNEGFAIVSDYVTTNNSALKFNQNWHFMPVSNPSVEYISNVKTNFNAGANIKIVCPDADISEIKDSIFSAGYGMAERSSKAVFTKYGQNVSITTLLLPYSDEEKYVSSASATPDDLSFSSAVFDIEANRGVFYAPNTEGGKFLDCTFDGDMAFVFNGRFYLSGGKKFKLNSVSMLDSPYVINDIYLRVSCGVVEIESSSLTPSTLRDEAIKIYAPKATHVLLNGNPIPFTLYSDYVYAVKAK